MVSKKKTIGVAVGSVFAAGMTIVPMASAAENPFALQSLQGGYMLAADAPAKAPEAKCGQGKCGSMKQGAAAKSGEAKCGQGKCGGMKTETPLKATEAKCGQGKCGAMPKK